jgi:hypothetical protein
LIRIGLQHVVGVLVGVIMVLLFRRRPDRPEPASTPEMSVPQMSVPQANGPPTTAANAPRQPAYYDAPHSPAQPSVPKRQTAVLDLSEKPNLFEGLGSIYQDEQATADEEEAHDETAIMERIVEDNVATNATLAAIQQTKEMVP